MTSASATANRRERGSIRPHRSGYQVRVTAGTDPATGERIVLSETSPTLKEAERARVRLLAEADAMKTARTRSVQHSALSRSPTRRRGVRHPAAGPS